MACVYDTHGKKKELAISQSFLQLLESAIAPQCLPRLKKKTAATPNAPTKKHSTSAESIRLTYHATSPSSAHCCPTSAASNTRFRRDTQYLCKLPPQARKFTASQFKALPRKVLGGNDQSFSFNAHVRAFTGRVCPQPTHPPCTPSPPHVTFVTLIEVVVPVFSFRVG